MNIFEINYKYFPIVLHVLKNHDLHEHSSAQILDLFPSHSVEIENSAILWSQRLQAQEEINRLKSELAIVRSQINNNQSTSHSTQPLPLMSTQSMNNHFFKLIQNLVSDNHAHSSQVRTVTNIITPNAIRSSPLLIPPTILVSSSPSSSQNVASQFSNTSQSPQPTSIDNEQLLQQHLCISTQNYSTNTSFN
ncbi:unnamed protein product [Rotaria socialis]|uniref:Uncharacterized protein n=1 Tax=Rotaria socialis TaxID=392032 RepID=A0A821N6Y7_9BILA|nr:unnamed protein product [Rotaria socialis]